MAIRWRTGDGDGGKLRGSRRPAPRRRKGFGLCTPSPPAVEGTRACCAGGGLSRRRYAVRSSKRPNLERHERRDLVWGGESSLNVAPPSPHDRRGRRPGSPAPANRALIQAIRQVGPRPRAEQGPRQADGGLQAQGRRRRRSREPAGISMAHLHSRGHKGAHHGPRPSRRHEGAHPSTQGYPAADTRVPAR